jgi:hypothetical protein
MIRMKRKPGLDGDRNVMQNDVRRNSGRRNCVTFHINPFGSRRYGCQEQNVSAAKNVLSPERISTLNILFAPGANP